MINLPLSNIASNISLLLANIKTKSYLRAEIITMAEFLGNSTSSQLDSLIQGLYGIYLDPTTTPQTSQNINALAPLVWRRVSEETKDRLGVRLAMSIASGNNEHGRKGRSFFEVVGGSQNLPEPLRVGEISDILTNLKNAHRNMNNFYNEPPFAQALERAIGDGRGIPRILERDYVNTIVEVFITNGNGIAYSADAVYERLINLFDERRAIIAIISYSQEAIASKLRFSMCQEKYKQLIGLVIPKITRQAAIDFANHLLSGKVPLLIPA